MRLVTYEELRRILSYDPYSGILKWRISPSKSVKAGAVAGCYFGNYVRIRINKRYYYAHRLAWLYMHGYFPEGIIDHKDRNGTNNEWTNLREVSFTCNIRNCGMLKNNTSGVKGVGWHKHVGKWQANIANNATGIALGYFDTFTEAVEARWAAEIKYNYPTCATTSSAYVYLKERGII